MHELDWARVVFQSFLKDILYREGSEMGGPDGDEIFACGRNSNFHSHHIDIDNISSRYCFFICLNRKLDHICNTDVNVNHVALPGWPKEFCLGKGLTIKIPPCHPNITVRIPSKTIYISTICNVKMSERTAIVRVPCIVRWIPLLMLRGPQDSLWQVHDT